MAKNVKIISVLPDGFLECEWGEGLNKAVVSVPPPPNKADGTDHTEKELLDYLATQWPENEFEMRRAPARASLARIKGKQRLITARVDGILVKRAL